VSSVLTDVSLVAGGVASFMEMLPQHTGRPEAGSPHPKYGPHVICLNAPAGGASARSPQQTIVPSVRSAHAESRLALTAVNVPDGAFSSFSIGSPQQISVESVAFTPQAKSDPVLTHEYVPGGGIVLPDSESPQHATAGALTVVDGTVIGVASTAPAAYSLTATIAVLTGAVGLWSPSAMNHRLYYHARRGRRLLLAQPAHTQLRHLLRLDL